MPHNHNNASALPIIDVLQQLKAPKSIIEAAHKANLVEAQEAPLIEPRAKPIRSLFRLFIDAAGRNKLNTGLALAALFDLLVGLDYIENHFVSLDSSIIKLHACGDSLYLPFTNACPRCLIERNQIVAAKGYKPPSAHIGEASSQILNFLFSLALSLPNSNNAKRKTGSVPASVFTARRTNAEVDAAVVFPEENIVLLGEVKASPLVTFPAIIHTKEGWVAPTGRTDVSVPVNLSDIASLGILLTNGFILKIGHPDTSNEGLGWAFKNLAKALGTDGADAYIRSWIDLYFLLKGGTRPAMQPASFFLTHGSGKRNGINVSDSKNAPGFDRTDDIKKATFQILALGAELLLSGRPKNIYTGVLSNIGPTHHFEDYLKEIVGVALFYPKVAAHQDSGVFVPKAYWKYIFDVILAFDFHYFNEKSLCKSLGALVEKGGC